MHVHREKGCVQRLKEIDCSTALFSVAMLGKHISVLKWISLCILVAGIGERDARTEPGPSRAGLMGCFDLQRQILD